MKRHQPATLLLARGLNTELGVLRANCNNPEQSAGAILLARTFADTRYSEQTRKVIEVGLVALTCHIEYEKRAITIPILSRPVRATKSRLGVTNAGQFEIAARSVSHVDVEIGDTFVRDYIWGYLDRSNAVHVTNCLDVMIAELLAYGWEYPLPQ